MKIALSLFIFAIIAGILMLLSSYHTQIVQLNYLFAKADLTLATALSIFLFLGFFISTLAWVLYITKVSLKLKASQRKIKKLNNEIELLHLQLKDK
ncbi:lipopolysaccharide assembly protein LapA domain-containing protein [Catenovulum maritimum]|uniref:Lipopolysaccharide assembly protein A domain-containing protein n=1 Tax=Catenovulum maritimum TaxID=1513271 RepID=A0A0J8H0J0_9ALTE|nr:LapA family protein [Catenovulum maritimum]KMT66513.1 hypothetical protein XM47_02965 [Catenovulum maritimum]